MKAEKNLVWGVSGKKIADDNSKAEKEPKIVEIVDNHIYFYSNVGRAEILTLVKEIRIMDGSLWREAQIQEMLNKVSF